MVDEKKEDKKEDKKEELKYPALGHDLRGNYYIHTEKNVIYQWSFPINASHQENLDAVNLLRDSIEKTIKHNEEKEKEAKKKKEEDVSHIPKETKVD